LRDKGIRETWRGKAWTNNCREWIHFDCVLKPAELKARLKLADSVTVHQCDDYKLGLELGLECGSCGDAIMGLHPKGPGGVAGKPIVE
jgi:hypothetical protein